jgi:hypothetical protein
LAAVALAGWASAAVGQLSYTKCFDDSEIAPAKRAALDKAAVGFVETLLGDSIANAYDLLSQGGRAVGPRDQFEAQVAPLIKSAAYKNLSVQHTYVVTLAGAPPQRVPCGILANANEMTFFRVTGVPEQAYVVLEAESRNNRWAVTVWLVPEDRTWKVQAFWQNVSTLGDDGPRDVLQHARAQLAKGHRMNAALLYGAARGLTERGPNMQLGLVQTIANEMAKMSVPQEVAGPGPYSWQTKTFTAKVTHLGPLVIAKKYYVAITHEVPALEPVQAVEVQNREVIEYFKARFPEYADEFSGIVVRANQAGTNKLYGTVDAPEEKK